MRTIVRSILCAAFAGGIGPIVEAVTRHLDPSLHFIAARMYGACAFCVVLLACMLVMRAQASAREF